MSILAREQTELLTPSLGFGLRLSLRLSKIAPGNFVVRRVEELFAFADTIEQKAAAALERVNNLTQSILAKALDSRVHALGASPQPTVVQIRSRRIFRGELTAEYRLLPCSLPSGPTCGRSKWFPTILWRAANPDLISGDNSAEALLAKIQAEREALKPVKKTRKKKEQV